MPGRNPKPIDLHLVEGKKHLTKSEIEHRKKAEIKMGNKTMKCPPHIRNNPEAKKKWNEVVKLYQEIDFVTSADAGIVARYCETYAEYLALIRSQELITNKIKKAELDLGEGDELDDIAYILKKVDYLVTIDGQLKLDKAINQKLSALVQLEDRIFLNPLARIKAIPKKEEPKEDPLASRGFGNV